MDIAGYDLLTSDVGMRAIEFAAVQHAGQQRLTGQVRDLDDNGCTLLLTQRYFTRNAGPGSEVATWRTSTLGIYGPRQTWSLSS